MGFKIQQHHVRCHAYMEKRQTGADIFMLHRLTMAAEAHGSRVCNACASSCKESVLAAQACVNVVSVISG